MCDDDGGGYAQQQAVVVWAKSRPPTPFFEGTRENPGKKPVRFFWSPRYGFARANGFGRATGGPRGGLPATVVLFARAYGF